MTQALSPQERIRRRAEFQRVYERGLRMHARFMTLFVLANNLPVTRLGVAATRKLGGAVQRNRAKRLLRAAMADLLTETDSRSDLLLVARSPLARANFVKTREALASLLKRAGLVSLPHDV